MPLVARSVTALSFITTRNGTASGAMITDSIIETDGYLDEVRRIQPASVLSQLSASTHHFICVFSQLCYCCNITLL